MTKYAKGELAMLNGTRTIIALVTTLLLAGAFTASAHAAGDLDVYILYAGKDSSEKNELMKHLNEKLNVKKYNVDLLALADYSGKQKAVARFGRAKVVVAVKDSPVKILKRTKVGSDLLITASTFKGMGSKRKTLRVVMKGTDLKKLGDVKTVEVNTAADLKNAKAILAADVVIVDDKAVGLFKATGAILQIVLDAQK